MAPHRRTKKSNSRSDSEYVGRFKKDIPQLPLRKIFVAHPKSGSNMGSSGPADSKWGRIVPPEIWLQVIKKAMPSKITVSTFSDPSARPTDGFLLQLYDRASLSLIMSLARLSKTWYSEVKQAFYALPLWSFSRYLDPLRRLLAPLSPGGSLNDASFVEYNAAISSIRNVEFWWGALRAPSTILQVPSGKLDMLFPLHRLAYIHVHSQYEYDIPKQMSVLGPCVEHALEDTKNIIARLGDKFSNMFSISATSHQEQNFLVIWHSNPDAFHPEGSVKDYVPANFPTRRQLLPLVPNYVAAVLANEPLVAAARANEAQQLTFLRRSYTNARIAAKVPKGHLRLRVERVNKLIWELWAKAPEPMGSRLPRRCKFDAIHRMTGLARKRPRVV